MGTRKHQESDERLRLTLEIVLLCVKAPGAMLGAIYLLILQLKRRRSGEMSQSVKGAGRIFTLVSVDAPIIIGA